MSLDFQVASLSYKSSSFATSRGNEKIGGTGYCVTYDTDSQSRNVLASPLGEEGHEVAKGWTVVILIMILDVDVTAEGGIIKLIAHRAIHNPRPEGPLPPERSEHNLPPLGGHNPRAGGPSTLTPKVCPMLLANIVISSGAACRYGRQTGTAPMML